MTVALACWLLCLGPYLYAGYSLVSRKSEEVQTLHPERVACASTLYIVGLVLMLGTDTQKYLVLKERKGLITHGFNAISRNCNYLGEIMIYTSFNVIAREPATWVLYLVMWSTVFATRMYQKELSLR